MSEQAARPRGARKREALELFAPLPRRYDRVAAVLSFGQDPRWRRTMVEAVRARADDRVLDVATGTGLVSRELVRRYGCCVVGLDQSPEMLARAGARLADDGELAKRVSLVAGEAESLPFGDGEFDDLTFTYLLRYVEDPAATMRELARVVKPGGRIASLEFSVPSFALWRWLWRLYTRVGLPLLGRAVSREWAHTGKFLAHSIPDFYGRYPMGRVVELWKQAGIANVHVRSMSLGGGVVMWGTKELPQGPQTAPRQATRDDLRGVRMDTEQADERTTDTEALGRRRSGEDSGGKADEGGGTEPA
jgi:demethylmenaquinone methyltransferase/2-methoxy-6-polyprenyl-1,4-benzoquinol methylase